MQDNIEINTNITKHYIFLSFRILRKIFPYGIIFHPGQIAVIKRALVSENPLVFFPVKQSSMDSVIVQRLLSKEFKLPTIQVKESFENDCYLPWLWNLFQNAFRYGKWQSKPWIKNLVIT